MFWKRKKSDPDRQRASDTERALDPVRVFTVGSIIDGWVDVGGQRLSDILGLEDLLSLSRSREPGEDDWFVIERDQILLVVPPPHTSDRAMRPHRVKRPILVRCGHYVVRGRVHMIAGIGLDPYLARSKRQFLPVTEAWVASSEWREVDEHHPVVLVNVRPVEGLQLNVVE